MFRKYSVIFIVLLIGLTACTKTEPKTDIEIAYEIRDSIVFDGNELQESIAIPTTDIENATIVWTSSNEQYLDIDGTVARPSFYDGDEEVTLTAVVTVNNAVAIASFDFVVLAEESDCTTCYTDIVEMDFTYEGKSFISDGVGEVTLDRCIDGDTALFKEGSSTFSVRFLGIDTPESTYRIDPWGKAASSFTCDKLQNATTLVLEADAGSNRTDNYGRYLAWVWYDGRLLNIEIIDEAYSGGKGFSGLKYAYYLLDATAYAQDKDIRVWGETDPNYDYSKEGTPTVIEDLVKHQEQVLGINIDVQGVISRMDGYSVFIQDGDYGIYVYNRDYNASFEVGAEVKFSSVSITYYPDKETGAVQITGVNRYNYEIISTDNIVTPVSKRLDELTMENVGTLVQVEGLTVKNITQSSNNDSFTVIAEDEFGNEIMVRRGVNANINLTPDLFEVGTEFTIVAPLGRFGSAYQLILTDLDDVTYNTNE